MRQTGTRSKRHYAASCNRVAPQTRSRCDDDDDVQIIAPLLSSLFMGSVPLGKGLGVRKLKQPLRGRQLDSCSRFQKGPFRSVSKNLFDATGTVCLLAVFPYKRLGVRKLKQPFLGADKLMQLIRWNVDTSPVCLWAVSPWKKGAGYESLNSPSTVDNRCCFQMIRSPSFKLLKLDGSSLFMGSAPPRDWALKEGIKSLNSLKHRHRRRHHKWTWWSNAGNAHIFQIMRSSGGQLLSKMCVEEECSIFDFTFVVQIQFVFAAFAFFYIFISFCILMHFQSLLNSSLPSS